MAPDDSSARPDPVVLRIKLRYADVDTFTERFAPHVGRSGLFLPTRAVQPLGTEVKFELRLADDRPVLLGMGKVRMAKAPDPAQPKAAFGLSVELTRVTRESRELILELLARRRQLGLAETDLPQAADIDAAKLARAATPVPPEPVAEAAPEPVVEAVPEVSSPSVAPLAPEPKRRPRTNVSELIAQASSGPVAMALPGLEDDVDVGAAILRARSITNGDFDRELESLFDQAFDQSAAPLSEISVEAASVELARQLGGVAVQSSQRWAVPPAVTNEAPEQAAPEEAAPEEAAPEEAAPEEAEPLEAAPVVAEAAPVEPDAADEGVIERDDEDRAHLARSESHAELHHLSESDYEEGEHTAVGAQPGESGTFDEAPPDDTLLAMHLSAEAATEPAGGRFHSAAVHRAPTVDASALDDTVTPSLDEIEEVQEFEILSEADLDDPDLLAVQGEAARDDHQAQPAEGRHWASFADFAARLELDEEDSDLYPRAPSPDPRMLDSRPLSVNRALASLEEGDEHGHFDPIDFDGRHAPFALEHAFDASDSDPEGEPDLDAETHARNDLETALEALDVDLDDLSLPHAPDGSPRPIPLRPRELSGRRRAARTGDEVDDGVEIDFEDD